MYFYHDRVQRNANDHLHPVLLSDFPADLRIVDADGTGWEESVAQDYGDDFFAGPFFRGSEYNDYSYLSDLSADAAPVIIPYMESLGYDFGAYELENPTDIMSEDTQAQWWGSYQPKGLLFIMSKEIMYGRSLRLLQKCLPGQF